MKLLYLCLVWSVSLAFASPLPLQARDTLTQGSLALVRALISPERPYLDHPLWKEAVAFGQMAKQLAPAHPEPYAFLAKVYSHLGWYERAWANYQSYKTLGGELSAEQQAQMTELARTLGYSLLMQGLFAEARTYLLLAYSDDKDPEIALHLARAYLGLKQAELAQVYLRQLEARTPGSEYGSYLELAEDQIQYGQVASQAFQQGVSSYYQGNLEAALEFFRQALGANTAFQKAFVWAGRTALELKRPAEALPYWQAAVTLNPQDTRASYFLDLSQNQLRWGSEAYQAFLDGLGFAEQRQLDAARQAFEQAVAYNPSYSAAWAQLGYLAEQMGDQSKATQAFAEALRLEPQNTAYQQAYQEMLQALEASQTQKVAEAVRHAAPVVMKQALLPQVMLSMAPEALSLSSDRTVSLSLLPYLEPGATGETLELLNRQHDYAPLTSASQSAITFFSSPDDVRGNLVSPVDYAGGTVYQRIEVLSKPSDALIYYQLCLVPDDDISIKPACGRASGLTLSQEGVYEFIQPLSSFYEYHNIDWRRGISSLMVILRNKDGSIIDAASAGVNSNLGDYFPMQVNYQVALVPSGGVFEGW